MSPATFVFFAVGSAPLSALALAGAHRARRGAHARARAGDAAGRGGALNVNRKQKRDLPEAQGRQERL